MSEDPEPEFCLSFSHRCNFDYAVTQILHKYPLPFPKKPLEPELAEKRAA